MKNINSDTLLFTMNIKKASVHVYEAILSVIVEKMKHQWGTKSIVKKTYQQRARWKGVVLFQHNDRH